MPDLFLAYPLIPVPDDPCPCGETVTALTPGKGPHAAALRCPNCHAFRRWVSKVEYEEFMSDDRTDGQGRRLAHLARQ